MSRSRHLAILGATASGKSSVALAIARAVPDVEIVSIDSMQVYRGMDIGTAKPTQQERAEVPHHLIDLADPSESFSVALFEKEARRVLEDIERRGKRAVLVGGTGLYMRAVLGDLEVPPTFPEIRAQLEQDPDTGELFRRLFELDPEATARIEPSNRRRIIRALEVCLGTGTTFSSFGPGLESYERTGIRLLGVWLPREMVNRRIEERYGQQIAEGFVDEVRALRDQGLARTARQALGYRELLSHLEEGVALDAALDEAIRRTKQFSRKQRMWFRRDPRITWFATAENPDRLVPALLRDWRRWSGSD